MNLPETPVHTKPNITMTDLIGSVRRLAHNWNTRDDPEMESSEFQSMEKPAKAASFRNIFRPPADAHHETASHYSREIDTRNDPTLHGVSTNKALSPKSASNANDRYQLMDDEEEETRQGPPPSPSTEVEKIQEGIHRLQQRVTDSWRQLQGASKRMVLNGKAALDRQAGSWRPASPRPYKPLEAVHQAVRKLKKSLGHADPVEKMDGSPHARHTAGFFRFDDANHGTRDIVSVSHPR